MGLKQNITFRVVQEEPKVAGLNIYYLFAVAIFFMIGFPIAGMSFLMLGWIAATGLVYGGLFYLDNIVEKVNKEYVRVIRDDIESMEHSNVQVKWVGGKKKK
jgi:hypothetical protein